VQEPEQECSERVDDEDPEREAAGPAALNGSVEQEAKACARAAQERDPDPEGGGRQDARLFTSALTAPAMSSPAAMLPRP
jgi:hypothetical protein